MVQIYRDEGIIFDLDDLLYNEFDFVRSGFWAVARTYSEREPKVLFRLMMSHYFLGNAVFDWLCNDYLKGNSENSINSVLSVYRNHKPNISLSEEVVKVLSQLKDNGNKMGLITDGRSITQRNKIDALKLSKWINDFTISEELGYEKPSEKPYLYFMEKFDCKRFVYLADNYNKDFISPNQLGWRTIALKDNGLNIHTIKENLDLAYYPSETINNFSELLISGKHSITECNNK